MQPSDKSAHLHRRHRSGVVIIYTIIALAVLLGFCSLAIDYGRAVCAKTQMQRAVDAAARAAVANLSGGTATAQNAAISMASNNLVDGSPLVLQPGDITFIKWVGPNNYTVVSASSANAVIVQGHRNSTRGNSIPLVFASIMGSSTCDVNATGTAFAGPTSLGLVGLTSVSMNGNAVIDSYSSSNGTYSSQSPTHNATVESNGDIDLVGNATIDGNALPGTGHSVSGKSGVTGSTTPLNTTLSFPDPGLPSTYVELGDISLTGNGSQTISAGVYHATGISVKGNGTLNITGAVTIYVSGSVDMEGNANVAQNLPENFNIQVLTNDSVKLAGNGELDADVYAPQSDITVTGNGDFMGGVVGNTLSIKGNGGIHDDLAGGGASIITLVK